MITIYAIKKLSCYGLAVYLIHRYHDQILALPCFDEPVHDVYLVINLVNNFFC
jgi:hypothetical protein